MPIEKIRKYLDEVETYMQSRESKDVEYYKTMYHETLADIRNYEDEVNQKMSEQQHKIGELGLKVGKLLKQIEAKSDG